MTTKTKWRLGKLPDPSEVALLLKEGILTKEEAREILISQETEEDRDKKSLQDEIKFLRQLVHSLASAPRIVEHIKYVNSPYSTNPWYQQYQTYCSSVDSSQTSLNQGVAEITYTSGSNAIYALNTASGSTQTSLSIGYIEPDFTDIKTF